MNVSSLQAESLGKLLPRLLLPYAKQWADRAGIPLLSRLLVDEHLRALIERYGEELFQLLSPQHAHSENGEPLQAGKPFLRVIENDEREVEDDAEISELHDRLETIEAQYETMVGLLETVRVKIRPLAAALGCCPECVVGVAGCPKCLGQSKVGHYEPNLALLQNEVINALAARGVRLSLPDAAPGRARRAPEEPSATATRSKSWPRK